MLTVSEQKNQINFISLFCTSKKFGSIFVVRNRVDQHTDGTFLVV